MAWFGPNADTIRLPVIEIPDGYGSQASLAAGIIQSAPARPYAQDEPVVRRERRAEIHRVALEAWEKRYVMFYDWLYTTNWYTRPKRGETLKQIAASYPR